MLTTVKGLVLRETPYGENDKFIDILTAENGIMEIAVKGARKINSKSGSATQLFAYSTFCVNSRGDRYYLNSTEPIKIFYDLRLDIEKLSLASYFSELVRYSVTSQQPTEEVLRLFLNTLHFLTNGERSIALLKSIFELRFMSEIGMMPDLVACSRCLAYEKEKMYLNVSSGKLLCSDCVSEEETINPDLMMMSKSLLYTVRFIILTDFERIFSFSLKGETLQQLNELSERFVLTQLDRKFPTLDFYKSMLT